MAWIKEYRATAEQNVAVGDTISAGAINFVVVERIEENIPRAIEAGSVAMLRLRRPNGRKSYFGILKTSGAVLIVS